MLECQGLTVSYGRHQALKGVDLQVAQGEIVVILGANGAGKTTLLNALAGRLSQGASGQVRLDGKSISASPPHQVVEAGLALVPEGRGVFGDLSVHENLLLGAFAQRARAAQQAQLQRVLGLFPKLGERRAQMVRTMSGGEQQMVAIGRALMSMPDILMLDEPSLGLSPLLCSELFRTLKEVRKTGVGILLVEQNARQSLAIADRAYLLENGHVVGEGAAQQMLRDPAVQAAYLGGAASKAAPPPRAESAQRPARTSAGVVQISPSSPALLPQGAAPARPPAGTRSADSLIATRIADLVDHAAGVQARHVEATRAEAARAEAVRTQAARTQAARSNGLAAAHAGAAGRATETSLPPLAAPKSPASLADAIAGIEAAAARARQRPTSATTPAAQPAASPSTRSTTRPAALPTIEIWRRPAIEIWRRAKDGQLKKED